MAADIDYPEDRLGQAVAPFLDLRFDPVELWNAALGLTYAQRRVIVLLYGINQPCFSEFEAALCLGTSVNLVIAHRDDALAELRRRLRLQEAF